MEPKITFRFICSGDSASYSIVAWNKPYHNVRIEIATSIQSLYFQDGTRRFNYTDEDYQKYVIDTCGYMRWNHAGAIPWEVVRTFNDDLIEQDKKAREKYPDFEFAPIRLVKGRYRVDPENWKTVIIEDLPKRREEATIS